MFATVLNLLLLFSMVFCGVVKSNESGNPWILGFRGLVRDCPVRRAKIEKNLTPSHGFVKALADCAKKRALVIIDRMLQDDVISVFNGLELIKLADVREAGQLQETPAVANRSLFYRFGEQNNKTQTKEDAESGSLREILTNRLARILKTHVIKIDVDRLRQTLPGASFDMQARSFDHQVEGRGKRRRRRQMQIMPMIMMGVLLMGSVLIPMGFQFLAVLGGKALILAKMALMLSSIQGLKKIATNGVNYGLYHTQVPEAWHERSGVNHLEVPYGGTGTYVDGVAYYANRRSAVQPT